MLNTTKVLVLFITNIVDFEQLRTYNISNLTNDESVVYLQLCFIPRTSLIKQLEANCYYRIWVA